MAHAAEWGHWYARDGSPVYEMPYADKRPGTRPVTLRDARKLGLVPGVSGISRCAVAPGLERWKAEQLLMAGLTLTRLEGEPEADWLARVWLDSQEQAKNAAAKGTAIHAAIQTHYEGKVPLIEYWNYVPAATKAINEWANASDWKPELPFACHLGFGGKRDLSRPGFLVDIKTKEFTSTDLDEGKQLFWDEQCIQLAAYRVGSGRPKDRCANFFVSTNQPGLVFVHEWKEEELERGWRMFLALLQYWQAKNKYNSSWIPEKVAA